MLTADQMLWTGPNNGLRVLRQGYDQKPSAQLYPHTQVSAGGVLMRNNFYWNCGSDGRQREKEESGEVHLCGPKMPRRC